MQEIWFVWYGQAVISQQGDLNMGDVYAKERTTGRVKWERNSNETPQNGIAHP